MATLPVQNNPRPPLQQRISVPNTSREQSYRYNLDSVRTEKKDQREITELTTTAKQPDTRLFMSALSISVIGDLLDVVAGFIPPLHSVQWAVDLFLIDIPLSYLGYVSQKSNKQRDSIRQQIDEKARLLSQNINFKSQRINSLKTKILGSGIGGIDKNKLPTKQLPSGRIQQSSSGKASQVIQTKSPLLNFIIASGLDLIPYVDLFPWRTVGVLKTHRQQKKSYRQLQEERDQYLQSSAEAEQLEKQLAIQRQYEAQMAEYTPTI